MLFIFFCKAKRIIIVFFFFSSRRRHTRWTGDWSSDVCSSDLVVEVYVSLKPGFSPGKEMEDKVSKAIETEIGKIARPKNVWIVPDMPKTRSGKIMRRVIASVS